MWPQLIAGVGSFVKRLELKDVLWIAAAVLCVLLLRQCSANAKLKEEARLSEQNALAMRDTVVAERVNNGKTVNAYKTVMVADMEQLKRLNGDLYKSIDSLKRVAKVRGDLFAVTSAGVTITSEPTVVPAEVVYVSPNGDVRMSFEVDTAYDQWNSRHLEGLADFHLDSMRVTNPRVSITNDVLRVGLATGITKDDGVYKIFVSSGYPGFSVSKLDGAVLDPKALKDIVSDESAWVFGPQLGYGYSFGSNKPAPLVGLGVTYNLNKQVKALFR